MGADYISWPDLVATIGEDAAMVMVGARGGTTEYIPKGNKLDKLANIVGERAAIELSALHGGTTLRFPSSRETAKEWILRFSAQGMSERDIVLRLKTIGVDATGTWVRKVRKYAHRRQEQVQQQLQLPIRCP